MSKAIWQTKAGRTVGSVALGARGGVAGSVAHQVHDGDTIIVAALGNLSVRFLAVDTPEMSYLHPATGTFLGLHHPSWAKVLERPFNPSAGPFPGLDPALRSHLKDRLGPGVAANHRGHAGSTERFGSRRQASHRSRWLCRSSVTC